MTRTRGLLPFLTTVTVLVLIISLFGFSASLNPLDVLLGRGRQFNTPDLTGMPLPSAKIEAERVGLRNRTRFAYSLTVQRGSVIRQDPDPGDPIRVGETIELTVSKGENSAPMPDAVGKRLKNVRAPLDDASIKVVVEEVFSETVDDDVVISQSPDPGVVLRGGETARFVVSKGAEKRPVPDVSGMTPAGAAFLIGQSGLKVREVVQVDDPTAVVGSVTSTTPAQGTPVAKGFEVTINVSGGPAAAVVPDVVGQTLRSATDALTGVGFRVETAAKVLASDDPTIGNVLEQRPAAGESLRGGQVVTIVVAVGPPIPPPTTTTTTTTTTPDSGQTPSTTSTTIRRSGGG